MPQRYEIRALNDAQAAVHDSIAAFPFYRAHLAQLLEVLAPRSGGVHLDLGCGTGNLIALARERGVELIGVDLSAGMLIQAWHKGCRLVLADLEALPFRSASVDAIVSLNVLWQLQTPARFVAECARLLRPGGRLVLSTPGAAEGPVEERFDGAILAAVFDDPRLASDAERLQALRRYGQINREIVAARDDRFHTDAELEALLEGFDVRSIEPAYAGQNWLVVADRRGEAPDAP